MKIIEIKPTKKSGGTWCAFAVPGVSPCYPGPSGKQQAIDYARNCRFGGSSGEILYARPAPSCMGDELDCASAAAMGATSGN